MGWTKRCQNAHRIVRLWLSIGAAAVVLGHAQSSPAKDADWQPINVDGRDYLSLDNIAHFYQLRSIALTAEHRVRLTDGRASLEVGNNPREVFINGIKQWLSFPALVRGEQVLISRFDLAKTIEPALRPTMVANLRPFRTVVIDAGHGGKDRGASSRAGVEKDYALDVCRDLKKTLETMGLRVVLTREDDFFLPLEGRAELANAVNDAVFVSLHFNSASDGGHANGFEVYAITPQGAASTGDTSPTLDQFEGVPGNDYDNASLAFATCVQYSLLGHIPQSDRGVRRARFAVLRLTHAPAILVEGGFLTNDHDSRSINESAWRERLAEAIGEGVKSFQEVAALGRAPKLRADYRSEQLPLLGTIVNPAALASRTPGSADAMLPVANSSIASVRPPPVRSGGGFPSPN